MPTEQPSSTAPSGDPVSSTPTEELDKLFGWIHDTVRGKDSIKGVVLNFLDKIDEVQYCTQTFIPAAKEMQDKNKEKLRADLLGLKRPELTECVTKEDREAKSAKIVEWSVKLPVASHGASVAQL